MFKVAWTSFYFKDFFNFMSVSVLPARMSVHVEDISFHSTAVVDSCELPMCAGN